MDHSDGDVQTAAAPAPYRALLREISEKVALPHTYTLLIWVTTMASVAHNGVPDLLSIFCMLAGACTAYVVVGGLSRGRGAAPLQPTIAHPYRVAVLNIVTLGIAAAACAGVAYLPEVHLAWLAVGLTGPTIFLLGVAAQARLVARWS